jgi:hypothetical protein
MHAALQRTVFWEAEASDIAGRSRMHDGRSLDRSGLGSTVTRWATEHSAMSPDRGVSWPL